jgi:hypothetical protein
MESILKMASAVQALQLAAILIWFSVSNSGFALKSFLAAVAGMTA